MRDIVIENEVKLEIEPTVYDVYPEEVVYADTSYDNIVKAIIESKKGCLILGNAGTGKTYLLNKLVATLNEDGNNIKRLAPTNVSALLINGETLDSFVNGGKKINKYKNLKYIFVDEVSMMKELFYQILLSLKLAYPDIKFIISGDFNQLTPVKDRVANIYEKSRCLYELVDGKKLVLTQCKRSDDVLFNICKNAIENKPIDVSRFQKQQEHYLNVCHTNLNVKPSITNV